MSIFAIDFDGTCVEHDYPHIGPDVPGAAGTLLQLVEAGHELILWTMRSGDELAEAVQWFERKGIPIIGANNNPSQAAWTASPKAYAHVYIDDAALGCPLIHPHDEPWSHASPRPYVNWRKVREQLSLAHYLPPFGRESAPAA